MISKVEWLIGTATVGLIVAGVMSCLNVALLPVLFVAAAAWIGSLTVYVMLHWINRQRDNELKDAIAPLQTKVTELSKKVDQLFIGQKGRYGQ